MQVRHFVRFGWLGIAVAAAFMGPVASGAAGPGPADGLVVDQTPNPGLYGNIIWSLSALGARDAWAVGGKATASSNDTLALHWNGTSWSAVPTPNPEVQCEDGDIMWAGQALTGVSGVSANDVWAVGAGCYGISPLVEHWNGSAWSLVPGARLGGPDGGEWASLSDVAAISSSNVWAVGYVSSGNGRPLIEHWSGTGWSEVQGAAAAESYLASISATGPNDVWAVGGTDAGTNLIEHWNGTAWSVAATPQPAASSLDSVAAISPVNAWAVGSRRASTGADVTFVLHWDGQSWSEVPSPNPSTTGDAVNERRRGRAQRRLGGGHVRERADELPSAADAGPALGRFAVEHRLEPAAGSHEPVHGRSGEQGARYRRVDRQALRRGLLLELRPQHLRRSLHVAGDARRAPVEKARVRPRGGGA
jgi:hypothetical protein